MAAHRNSYWAMDTADWAVEADGGCVTLTAPDESGDLQIQTCDSGPDLMTLGQAQAWARQRSPHGTPIREALCGQSSGVVFEVVDAEGVYWRVWVLSLAEMVLLVNYRCESGDGGRHRAVVDRMLSSLTDNRG